MKFKCSIAFKIVCILVLQNLLVRYAQGQVPPEKFIKILITPDHSDWLYKIGEQAKFDIKILKNSSPLTGITVDYEIGEERLTPAIKTKTETNSSPLIVNGGTLKKPGFLRCAVTIIYNGIKYRNLTTVGYEPERIQPFTEMPADFVEFWTNAKKELGKYANDYKITLLPERCTDKVNTYMVNIQGYGRGSRLYGILCMPKKEGKYPALLRLPGAGIRPYNGDPGTAEQGVITLEIGIHGIPVNLDPSIYSNLDAGALKNYQNINLDDRDQFYYKRVYLNCIRANDFLVSLPEFDGANLGVTGGSQGGGLTLVTAGLDKRVTCYAVMYPALCDLTGELHGRAGGWPHYFDQSNISYNNTPEKIKTCAYYDAVNFAKQISAPGFVTSGYNDEVCPPTTVFGAYNNIKATKTYLPMPETGHWAYSEQYDVLGKWLLSHLNVTSK